MTDTITVASRVHTAIVIHEPLPAEFAEKPGNAPALRSVTLNGASHPAAVGEVGITRGVDAEMFRKWRDANEHAPMVANGLVYEIADADVDKASEVEFGFTPALDRMAADGANIAKASEGSTDKDADPAKDTDMAATSDVPNDDSPRSQSGLV